jgi:hypothetical protein|tara:strand:- start:785 stop:1168 length:384 start_codon:yes stop_codon:yes gene_type:complete
MRFDYKWECEDVFDNILIIELKPHEIFARMTPIVKAGPKKLYFNMSLLSILKMYLGYLVREMRMREKNFYREFKSDVIPVTKCTKPPLVMLSFDRRQLWLPLRGIVEIKRKISDDFVDIKLAQKQAL